MQIQSKAVDNLFLVNGFVAKDLILRFLLSVGAGYFIIAILFLGGADKINNASVHLKNDTLIYAISCLLIAPIIENAMLIGLISLITRFGASNIVAVAFGAAVAAIFHGLFFINWMYVVFVPFFVMGATYIAYRSRSEFQGWIYSIILHAAQNSIPLAYFFIFE